jgi:hypothetical protein
VTADSYVPASEDRFSFSIWTVGWQGVDVFGGAVRPPMPADLRPLGWTGLQVSPVCIGTSPLASMPALYGYEVVGERAEETIMATLRPASVEDRPVEPRLRGGLIRHRSVCSVWVTAPEVAASRGHLRANRTAR